MSPETKEVLDYLLAFLAPGAAGGIVLAVIGWMKASKEKPHIAPPPTVGAGALAQIGGMVVAQKDMRDFIEGLGQIAASQDRCTLAREAEMQLRKKLAEEHREHERKLLEERRSHEKKLAEDRHDEHRDLLGALRTLSECVREIRRPA